MPDEENGEEKARRLMPEENEPKPVEQSENEKQKQPIALGQKSQPLFPLPIVFGVLIAALLIMLAIFAGQAGLQRQLKTAVAPTPTSEAVAEWCPDRQDKVKLDTGKVGRGNTELEAKIDCHAKLDLDCSQINLEADGVKLCKSDIGSGCKVTAGTFKCNNPAKPVLVTVRPPASPDPETSTSPQPTGLWEVECRSSCDCEVGCEQYCPNKEQWVDISLQSNVGGSGDPQFWPIYTVRPMFDDMEKVGWACYKDSKYEKTTKKVARDIVEERLNKCMPGSLLWNMAKNSDKDGVIGCDRGCILDWATATPSPRALQCVKGPIGTIVPARCQPYPPLGIAGFDTINDPEEAKLYEGSMCCSAEGSAKAKFTFRCTENPSPPPPPPAQWYGPWWNLSWSQPFNTTS